MSTVIALFPPGRDVNHEILLLKDGGVAEDNLRLLTRDSAIRKLLGCDPTCVVTKYARRGALLVGVIYVIAALVASWCECNIFNYSEVFAINIIFAAILVGGFIGAIMGSLVGIAEFEKDSHLYTQGARRGGKVLVLQVPGVDVEKAMEILRRGDSTGVRLLHKPKKD
jgi:hypothetical protein